MTQHHQRLWLALLTVLILSMQSFAIWHDAEHAFHSHNEQCERYEAFAHTPALDAIEQTSISTFTPFGVTVASQSITLISQKQRNNDAIRAPPIFS